MSETSSRENNARVEAVTRMSTEKSGCDWTWPYNARSLSEVLRRLIFGRGGKQRQEQFR